MQISMLFQKKPPSALPPVLCTGRRPGGRLMMFFNFPPFCDNTKIQKWHPSSRTTYHGKDHISG